MIKRYTTMICTYMYIMQIKDGNIGKNMLRQVERMVVYID